MKKLIILVISILSLISDSAFCQSNYQDGYIVTLKKDTIRGSIDYDYWKSTPQKILFFNDSNNDTRQYTAEEITAFSVASEKYVSRTFSMDTSSSDFQSLTWSSKSQNRTQTAFLRVLIQGRGTLFLFKENKRRHFFMEEDTLKVTELLSKDYLEAINMVANKTQYKGQLKYYWRNYPSLTAQINRLNYDEKSLMNLFENYEKLHGGQPYIEQANKGLDVKFQVVGGLSLTKLAFKSNLALSNIEKADFNNTLSPVLGFAVELMPFKQGETRKINRISFYNEILYKKFVSEGIATKYFTDQIESIDIYKLGFSYLRLSTAVRYQSTGENFKYFASLGFTGALLLKTYNNSHIYRYYTFNTTNFIEKQDESIAYLSKYEIGYLGSLGLKYRQFSLEMRYESSTGMSQKTLIINPIVSQFHFLLGYRFGKTKS